MSDFATRSTLGTAGDESSAGPKSSSDLGDYDEAIDRNAMADCARQGEGSSTTAADVGWQCDARFVTTADEVRRGGWDKLAKPSGGDPDPLTTAGMRGDQKADGIPGDD